MLANTRETLSREASSIARHAACSASVPRGPASCGSRRMSGSAPKTRRYASRWCASITRARRSRLPPCSAPSSSGPSACDHTLSLRPSQNSHGPCPTPTTGMARRVPAASPCATARPSWKWRAGSWQLAQETAPLRLSRASKNSCRPSSAAAGEASWRLDGSAGAAGSSLSLSDASSASSSRVQRSRLRAADGPDPGAWPAASTPAASAAIQKRFLMVSVRVAGG